MNVKRINIILLLLFIILLLIGALFLVYKPVSDLVRTGINYGSINRENIADYNTPLQKKIDILHYNIKLNLHFKEKTIDGDVKIIGVKLDSTLKSIDLNFYDNFNISSLVINNKNAAYINDERLLSVSCADVPGDTFSIRIKYEGTPKKLGLGSFNFDEKNGKPFIYTLSEPIYASTWYPCSDMPSDKALLDIYIKNDSSMVSVSNGKLIDVSLDADKKIYHWKTYYPISTYLIAIYSANYKYFGQKYISVTGDTLGLDYYVTEGKLANAKNDFAFHTDALKFFEKTFGPYPFIKEKYGVAEFLWPLGAMEHQTITGIGSRYIGGKNFFKDIYIHELAHHWWGDAVGPATWKDVWLNEGFATYSEALYWESESGRQSLQSTMQSKFDNYSASTLYNPSNNIFGRLVYNKGAWVLHMLRYEVGDAVFFKILRNYFKEYKYKNASTENFKNICERISGKSLNYFFDQWVLSGTGLIEAEYKWQAEELPGGKYSVNLRLNQVQQEYDTYRFPLDIKFKYKDRKPDEFHNYIFSSDTSLNFVTVSKPDTLIFDPDHWLLAFFSEEMTEK